MPWTKAVSLLKVGHDAPGNDTLHSSAGSTAGAMWGGSWLPLALSLLEERGRCGPVSSPMAGFQCSRSFERESG